MGGTVPPVRPPMQTHREDGGGQRYSAVPYSAPVAGQVAATG